MSESLFDRVYALWVGGGMVMPGLFVTAFVLWFALGQRLLLLRRGDRRSLRVLVGAHLAAPGVHEHGIVHAAAVRWARLWQRFGGPVPEAQLDEAFGDLHERLRAFSRIVGALVAMAPLLGLLGTVTGLIETFGALGTSSASAASEGIAGGIVEALYATQMGLAIAVPGLLTHGFLNQRHRRLAMELETLRAIYAGAMRVEVRP